MEAFLLQPLRMREFVVVCGRCAFRVSRVLYLTLSLVCYPAHFPRLLCILPPSPRIYYRLFGVFHFLAPYISRLFEFFSTCFFFSFHSSWFILACLGLYIFSVPPIISRLLGGFRFFVFGCAAVSEKGSVRAKAMPGVAEEAGRLGRQAEELLKGVFVGRRVVCAASYAANNRRVVLRQSRCSA